MTENQKRKQKSDNRLQMIDDSILVIQVSYLDHILQGKKTVPLYLDVPACLIRKFGDFMMNEYR